MKKLSKILSYFEYHILWPFFYWVFKLIYSSDKKTVLFADSYSTELTDNMKPIYKELEDIGGYKLLTAFPKSQGGVGKIRNRLSRSKAAIGFLKKYAQAGTLILTESYLPAYCVKPRAGTKVIQLWHGCGAFKKWGYSTLENSFGATKKDAEKFPMHNCYTLVPVSAPTVAFAYADAFNCDKEIVKPLGVPRTDVYFNDEFVDSAKDKLCELFPELKGRKIILYAPTFRGENITDAKSGIPLDFELLNDFLNNLNDAVHATYEDYRFAFVCKLHPFLKDKVSIPTSTLQKSTDNSAADINEAELPNAVRDKKVQAEPLSPIIDASTADIDLLLCAADILVTDYSSIIFEYSLLERPMLFYAHDLESYTAERDFYFPYNDFVPGDVVTTQFQLQKALLLLSEQILKKPRYCPLSVKSLQKNYMSSCDGNSTQRIIKYINSEDE